MRCIRAILCSCSKLGIGALNTKTHLAGWVQRQNKIRAGAGRTKLFLESISQSPSSQEKNAHHVRQDIPAFHPWNAAGLPLFGRVSNHPTREATFTTSPGPRRAVHYGESQHYHSQSQRSHGQVRNRQVRKLASAHYRDRTLQEEVTDPLRGTNSNITGCRTWLRPGNSLSVAIFC